jgi:hypothetical protein
MDGTGLNSSIGTNYVLPDGDKDLNATALAYRCTRLETTRVEDKLSLSNGSKIETQ